MKNAELKRLKDESDQSDEIRDLCDHCGVDHLVAYWDDELEYYIYLSDTPSTCLQCQKTLHCETA